MSRHVYRQRRELPVAARVFARQRCRIGLMMRRLLTWERMPQRRRMAHEYNRKLDYWLVRI